MDPGLQALDHHGTVTALAAALPDLTEHFDSNEELAEKLAANLASVGLVLVPLGRVSIDPLRQQAAETWFSPGEV